MSRVLFLTPRFPHPLDRGDRLRAFHLIRALSGRVEITLLSYPGPAEQVEGFRARQPDVRVRLAQPRAPGRLAANLRLPPRVPLQVRLFASRQMDRALADELADAPDAVHVSLARMGPYLPPPGPWHRHVDLVDSYWQNMGSRAERMPPGLRAPFQVEARLMRGYEAALAACADSCSVVAEADRRTPGLESTFVVPNGVDPDAFPYSPPSEADRSGPAIFFGNLGYFHNAAAAEFLAREVAPLLPHEAGIDLRLVGSRPTRAVRALGGLERVTVVGPVAEIAPELHAASVAALPVLSGSGMKNKVLEAFAAGLPVVANSIGIDGIEGAVDGVHYRRADTATAMAEAIAELREDRGTARHLAQNARELVVSRYSWRAQAERLLELYGLS